MIHVTIVLAAVAISFLVMVFLSVCAFFKVPIALAVFGAVTLALSLSFYVTRWLVRDRE